MDGYILMKFKESVAYSIPYSKLVARYITPVTPFKYPLSLRNEDLKISEF